MARKSFCDICDKEINYRNSVTVGIPLMGKEYCKECWIDIKNWEKIHELKPSEE